MERGEEEQNQTRIPKKRIKLQEIVEKGEEDRISGLPDCLLLEILSRLPSTVGAIRTGTLSKRWNHLWTLLPTLIFKEIDDNLLWSNYIMFVDQTLAQCSGLKLKKFLVSVTYDTQSESRIKTWIRYAINRNVEELNLALWNYEAGVGFLLDQFFFINSCFTKLTLRGCILDTTGAIGWKNLRSLCICFAYLDEDLIENILSGSPVLETLVLRYCHGYRHLDITSKSVKNLVFHGYNMLPDALSNIIEINAPNILSLTIQGNLMSWKLLLVNVSSLVEANLDYTKIRQYKITHEEEMLKGFIVKLRHVKELKIGVLCSEVLSCLEAKGFIFPSNMKFPVVIHDDWLESDDSVESGNRDLLLHDHCPKDDEVNLLSML
ncbi:unnamed protein product [Lactuca virosa]|uniref:F-box domain-containing protein n=1 Tax=Lactuca virosa TaxID=75947 RepID=A0AAU9PDW0_9ASTR|nr:unnamed protein product [Lactuca virosa]